MPFKLALPLPGRLGSASWNLNFEGSNSALTDRPGGHRPGAVVGQWQALEPPERRVHL